MRQENPWGNPLRVVRTGRVNNPMPVPGWTRRRSMISIERLKRSVGTAVVPGRARKETIAASGAMPAKDKTGREGAVTEMKKSINSSPAPQEKKKCLIKL